MILLLRRRSCSEKTVVSVEKQQLLPKEEASSGAVADNSAPLSAHICPTCDAPMKKTGLRVSGTDRFIWRCPLCNTESE